MRKINKTPARRAKRGKVVARRDRFAAALENARYRKRVVESAKRYSRKKKSRPCEEDDA